MLGIANYLWEMCVLLPFFITALLAFTVSSTPLPRADASGDSAAGNDVVGKKSGTGLTLFISHLRLYILTGLYATIHRLQRVKNIFQPKKKSFSKMFQFNLGDFVKMEVISSILVVGWLLYLHGVMTSFDSNSTVGLHTLTNATMYVGCSYARCTLPLTIYTSWNLACVTVMCVMWFVGVVFCGSSSDGLVPKGAANKQRRDQPILLLIPEVPAWACVWNFPSSINIASSSSSFTTTMTIPSIERYLLALICRMLGCALVSWFSLHYRTIPSFSILVVTIPNIEVVVRCVVIGMWYRRVALPWVVLGSGIRPSNEAYRGQPPTTLTATDHLIEGIVDGKFENHKKSASLSVLGALICFNRWFIGACTIASETRGHIKEHNAQKVDSDTYALFRHRRSTLCLVADVLCGVGLTDVDVTKRLGFQPAYSDAVMTSITMKNIISATSSSSPPAADVNSWNSINTPTFAAKTSEMVVQYKSRTLVSPWLLWRVLQKVCIRGIGGYLLISSLLQFVFSTTLTLTSVFFPGSALFTDQHEWVYGGSTLFNSVFMVMIVFGVFQFAHWILLAALPLLVEIKEVRKLRAKQFGRRRDHHGGRGSDARGGVSPPTLAPSYPPPPPSSLWTADRRPLSLPTHDSSTNAGVGYIPSAPKYINPNHVVQINLQDDNDDAVNSAGHGSGVRGSSSTTSLANVFERLLLTLISQELVPLAVALLHSEGVHFNEM
jgi:hypothetical protein